MPWRRASQPFPVFLPGESPWTQEPGGLQSMGSQESDTTEHRGFPGGPGAKTPCAQVRGPRFNPWSGS